MNKTIDFRIKTEGELNSIQIYKPHEKEGKTTWVYIDSVHGMTNMELYWLKNYLQQHLQQTDW